MKIILTVIMTPVLMMATIEEDFPIIEIDSHYFQVTDMEHLHDCPACWEDQ